MILDFAASDINSSIDLAKPASPDYTYEKLVESPFPEVVMDGAQKLIMAGAGVATMLALTLY